MRCRTIPIHSRQRRRNRLQPSDPHTPPSRPSLRSSALRCPLFRSLPRLYIRSLPHSLSITHRLLLAAAIAPHASAFALPAASPAASSAPVLLPSLLVSPYSRYCISVARSVRSHKCCSVVCLFLFSRPRLTRDDRSNEHTAVARPRLGCSSLLAPAPEATALNLNAVSLPSHPLPPNLLSALCVQ